MSFESILLLNGILAAMSWTPGPNNALLAASGARFGWRATQPHILGIAFGAPLMLFIIALGLGEVFQKSALLREVLRWAGGGLMLYLAWKIASANPSGKTASRQRPFRLYEAMAFQWINPKAWIMVIAVSAQFVSGTDQVQEAAITASFSVFHGLTSASGWAWFGVWMQRWLKHPLHHRLFNVAMAMIIALGSVMIMLSRF